MSAQFNLIVTVCLMGFAAGGYALATLGMKLASDQLNTVALALMIVGFVAAAALEIVLLKNANLALIYIGIMVVESVLVMVFAAMLGDTLTVKQLSGAAMVLLGFMLVSL